MTVFGVGAAETFEFSGVCAVITEIEALTANRLLKAGVFPDHLLSIRRIKNFIIILKIMKFDFSLEIRPRQSFSKQCFERELPSIYML